MSRYPASLEQIIPPFSQFWIMMVEDLWRYAPGQTATVRACLPGCRAVLEWFQPHLKDGVLSGHVPWWNFLDWLNGWHHGVHPVASAGLPCASLNMQYLAAIQAYHRLLLDFGCDAEAGYWAGEADRLAQAIVATFWDADRNLFREGTDSSWGYTQHAQAWGLLSGIVPADAINSVADSLHDDTSLAQSTYYQSFYIVEALAKVGRLERLWDKWLAPWRNGLSLHFSTWPEKPEPTRSDCHAWSAWPSYALITYALGVRPTAPGFASHEIAPHRINGWDKLSGSVPTPRGMLNVTVEWAADGALTVESHTT
jgi:hypothetical protein